MKTFGKILGGVLACLAVQLVALRITGLGPHDRMAELWPKGNCLAYNGQLYPSPVFPVATTQSWNENVTRDPHVRIKTGNRSCDQTLSLVTDPVEKESVLKGRARKYLDLKIPANSTVHVFMSSGESEPA